MTRGDVWLLVLGIALGYPIASAEGVPVAKIGQSGDSIDLVQQSEGQTVTSSLPLYHKDDVRYFSAGVGLEERSAAYPPFPLKIIFTAGGKPFLSGVAVTIHPVKGKEVTIPREQVEGPWLFVDLPPGLYDVTATYGDRVQQIKGVRVEAGKQRVVYLRWKEDLGVARLPVE